MNSPAFIIKFERLLPLLYYVQILLKIKSKLAQRERGPVGVPIITKPLCRGFVIFFGIIVVVVVGI